MHQHGACKRGLVGYDDHGMRPADARAASIQMHANTAQKTSAAKSQNGAGSAGPNHSPSPSMDEFSAALLSATLVALKELTFAMREITAALSRDPAPGVGRRDWPR